MTAIVGAALLAAMWSVSHSEPLVVSLVIAVMLDAAGLVAASQFSAGNDAAVIMPFVGAVILIPALEGRRLSLALALSWLVGVVGVGVAFSTPTLSHLPNVVSPLMEGTIFGLITAPGYAILGWVAEHRRVATAQALDAAAVARRAEQVQQRTAETLRMLVESSPLPTLAFDRHGLVHAWNPAAERLLGWGSRDRRPARGDLRAG